MATFDYRMPELGEGLHEGEIVKWHIKPGDKVEEDQILMEVQNDKAVVEVPSPVTGTVKEIKVAEGTVAVVGDVLATFDAEGELPPAPAHGGHGAAEPVAAGTPTQPAAAGGTAPAAQGSAVATAAAEQPAAASAAAPTPAKIMPASSGFVLATPSVRRLARERGIVLAQLQGTGKNGRITRADVVGAAEAPAASAAAQTPAGATAPAAANTAAAAGTAAAIGERAEERVPLKGIRRAIAAAMVKSVYTAPHVTVMDEVDVTALVALRQKAKPLAESKGVKLTYLPFIVKALIAAVKRYPVLNASLDDEKNEIVYKKYYSIGIATDTDNGLIVPVVADADRKSMWQIAAEIKDLATRGRDGKLQPQEMKGSTISITNIGSAGGMFFTPVINYPEVAILGTGRITEKPIVKNGEIAIGQMMALSLSFDHRIIDGATAQNAVNYIKQLLEDPQLLIMEV